MRGRHSALSLSTLLIYGETQCDKAKVPSWGSSLIHGREEHVEAKCHSDALKMQLCDIPLTIRGAVGRGQGCWRTGGNRSCRLGVHPPSAPLQERPCLAALRHFCNIWRVPLALEPNPMGSKKGIEKGFECQNIVSSSVLPRSIGLYCLCTLACKSVHSNKQNGVLLHRTICLRSISHMCKTNGERDSAHERAT